MPIRTLGKAMFPRQQPWKRERTIWHLLIAIAVAIVFAAIVVGVMFMSNTRTH